MKLQFLCGAMRMVIMEARKNKSTWRANANLALAVIVTLMAALGGWQWFAEREMRELATVAARASAIDAYLRRIDAAREANNDASLLVETLTELGVHPSEYSLRDLRLLRLELPRPHSGALSYALDIRGARISSISFTETPNGMLSMVPVFVVEDTRIDWLEGHNVRFVNTGSLHVSRCRLTGMTEFTAGGIVLANNPLPSFRITNCIMEGGVGIYAGVHRWNAVVSPYVNLGNSVPPRADDPIPVLQLVASRADSIRLTVPDPSKFSPGSNDHSNPAFYSGSCVTNPSPDVPFTCSDAERAAFERAVALCRESWAGQQSRDCYFYLPSGLNRALGIQ